MRVNIKSVLLVSAMTLSGQYAWADFNDEAKIEASENTGKTTEKITQDRMDKQDALAQNLRPHPKHHFNMNAISNKEESHHEGGKYIYVPHPKGNFLIKRYVGS